MAVDVEGALSAIQAIFRPGVVVIVGSGASCAYGLPGMGDLASHLLSNIPHRDPPLHGDDAVEWKRISEGIEAGRGLEEALGPEGLPDTLADHLAACIAEFVGEAEMRAITSILGEPKPTAFGRLFAYALRTRAIVDVITTNYDRLIEVQAAKADIRVDTMYYGHTVGRLDSARSREELLMPATSAGRRSLPRLEARPHLRLAKPHGSLDWFSHQGELLRTDFDLLAARQIIAPGVNKYRLGYEAPFDAQRNRANAAIGSASAFFIVGYGFNDDHLQTHLRTRFRQVPSIVLAKQLTIEAKTYLASNASSVGIESAAEPSRCHILQGGEQFELDRPLWQVETIVEEVLGG